MTQRYIERLVQKYRDINEIWLFGSRVASTQCRVDSDWDYLVLTDSARLFLDMLEDPTLPNKAIDLFVQVDDDIFAQPWLVPGSDGLRRKGGTFSNWRPEYNSNLGFIGDCSRARSPMRRVFHRAVSDFTVLVEQCAIDNLKHMHRHMVDMYGIDDPAAKRTAYP